MIIFINGSFGIGKSSVAEYLTDIISNSMLFDGEEVGYMLHKIYKPIDNPGEGMPSSYLFQRKTT